MKPLTIFTPKQAAELRFARLCEEMEAIADQAMEEKEKDAQRHRSMVAVGRVAYACIGTAVVACILFPSPASVVLALPLVGVAWMVAWGVHGYDRDEHLAHQARMAELAKRRDTLIAR